MADPFHWKVEDVVALLCNPSSEVTDEPEVLADKIRENRFNGKRLLTYTIIVDLRQLQEHLGLTKGWQHSELALVIDDLQRQSPAFQEWKARRDAVPASKSNADSSANLGIDGSLVSTPNSRTDLAKPGLIIDDQHTKLAIAVPHLNLRGVDDRQEPESERAPEARTQKTPEPPQGSVTEADTFRPPKRRRMAPTNVSSETGAAPQISFAVEEDYLSPETYAKAYATNIAHLETVAPGDYLGKGALSIDGIRSTSTRLSTRLSENADGGFSLVLPNKLPPGRRLVVYRETRRQFRQNQHHENLLRDGFDLPSREGSLALEDLPSEYDERTREEYEKEMMEREMELEQNLSADSVNKLMDDYSNDITTKWEEAKLPKYERQAFKLWSTATRRGSRKFEAEASDQETDRLKDRLKNLRSYILDELWKYPREVLKQSSSLEATLEQICYHTWLTKLLTSNERPPRCEQLPRRKRAPKPREQLSDGEEILTSSDDDAGFIVDDDEAVTAQLEEDVEHAARRLDLEPKELKVAALPLVTPQKTQPEVIDLTSPAGSYHVMGSSNQPNSQLPAEEKPPTITSELVMAAQGKLAKKFGHGKLGMLLCHLWDMGHKFRSRVFAKADETDTKTIWNDTVNAYLTRIAELPFGKDDPDAHTGSLQPEDLQTAFEFSKLFLLFYKERTYADNAKLITAIKKQLSTKRQDKPVESNFIAFLVALRQAAPLFPDDSQIFRQPFDPDELLHENMSGDEEFDDGHPAENTPTKARRTTVVEVVQDRNAMDLREREARRNEEIIARRQKLRAQLEESGTVPAGKIRHIINEGKEDHQGLIYINQEIGKRIKEHQIDGVRFLWNQIVQDASERQGCLLAHTMGLGKTMQVITFLVALHEAANSGDPTIREQVPQDMRQNPTLILCPAGLVDNWMDELLTWSPAEALTPLIKVDSQLEEAERENCVRRWTETGGTLVVGYDMMKRIFRMTDEMAELLTETPTTVIADEAHKLKNSASQLHQICSQFRTKSRIALTGSPLANNVNEYYHMIDWVAPNFLGPPQEFKDIYSKVIEAGLYHDSLGSEKRHAIKMLQVLKETVAPKVHRATIAELRDDLPNKHEFVISVAPTLAQTELYNACIQAITGDTTSKRQPPVFEVLDGLRLICNHPKCLHVKAKDAREKAARGDESLSAVIAATALTKTSRMDIDNPALSSKMLLLTKILDEARAVGDKVLVFSVSIPTLQYLEHMLISQKRSIALLTGQTSIASRQSMVSDFNTGSKEVYLISTKAGGVGLNIQGANRVVLLDFGWNPMDEQQAIGRAYRIGQQKPVFVYRLVLAGTFEEALHNKAIFKTQLASRVVDKKNPISWSKRGGELIHEVVLPAQTDLTSFHGKDSILNKLIKDFSRVVMSIMSTDTFEEEDHTAVLTADELKEARTLVDLNWLRLTDPEAYRREQERHRLAQSWSSATNPSSVHMPPSTQFANGHLQPPMIQSATRANGDLQPFIVPDVQDVNVSLAHSMDGVSDFPLVRSRTTGGVFGMLTKPGGPKLRYHGPSNTSTNLAAPPMMAGANTYIGNHTKSTRRGVSTDQEPCQGTFHTNLSKAKGEFEQEFVQQVVRLRGNWSRPQRFSEVMMAGIVREVDQLRKNKALGFLPDDLQWRSLRDHLKNTRFTAAAAFRRFTPQWLAFASRQDIKTRLQVLEEMSDSEFSGFLEGSGNSTDPTVRYNLCAHGADQCTDNMSRTSTTLGGQA
jgi:SNF2 family DNA or RNA helicase